jgi:hypothetical protein
MPVWINGDNNKETKNLKGNQKEILELKITVTKVKNSQEGFNSWFEQAEERMDEPEDRTTKTIESKEQKKNKKTKNKKD